MTRTDDETPASLHTPLPQLRSKGLAMLALAALVFALLTPGCGRVGREDVPTNGWWSERGPVVPHDSFPTDCSLCHKGGDWQSLQDDFVFDHEAETGVALIGAHRQAECLRCHNDRGPVTTFAAKGCAGCHEDVHQAQLGNNCSDCHDEFSWRPDEIISTHAATRFPLVGSHAAVGCWRCHPGSETGQFLGASVECGTCHADQLVKTTQPGSPAPDHMVQGWVSDCDRCHIPTTWNGAGFNHVGFALTGAHLAADCSACHTGGNFTGQPTDCLSCHTGEYNTAPDHAALGYPTSCDACHGTSSWQGAQFNHPAAGISTGCDLCHLDTYVATTAPDHQALGLSTACETCHKTNAWTPSTFAHQGIVDTCVACHLANYQATTNPDHQAQGISTTCESCHQSTKTWLGAAFDHTGITSGCVDCHLDNYQTTTNPDHVTAGFPTSCESCHTTNSWYGAVFDHSFPIDSGDHKNFDCIDCHENPSNYASFTCFSCHEHNQTDMDKKHKDISGYVYTSPACLSCHPDGKE